MKNIILSIVLIVGIIAFLVSCSSSDDSSDASSSSCTVSTTASGTISDFSSTKNVDNLTGTYYLSMYGETPNGGCFDNGSYVNSMISNSVIPSDSSNFKMEKIITSSTSFTELVTFYSDNNSCNTVSGYYGKSFTNVSVGDNITMTSAPSPYPSYATKISYTESCFKAKGVTDTATTFLNNISGVSGVVTGTEHIQAGSESTYYNIATLNDNLTNTTKNWFYFGPQSTSAYPDNFSSSSGDTMYQ